MMNKALILLAMLVAAATPDASAAASSDARPNVVLIMTDDQGYGDLSCHGNPVLKTPNLDRLYNESVRLTDYHVAPTCTPTRAALMTGHWSNRTGAWHTTLGRSLLREDEITLGQIFNEAGYATAMFGKWHLGDNYPFRPEDRGFGEVMRHGGGTIGEGGHLALDPHMKNVPIDDEDEIAGVIAGLMKENFGAVDRVEVPKEVAMSR